jgi:hypothetical protein
LLFSPNNQFREIFYPGLPRSSRRSRKFPSELVAPQPGVVKTSKFGARLRVGETHALVHWKDYQESSLWESLSPRLDYCKVQRAG